MKKLFKVLICLTMALTLSAAVLTSFAEDATEQLTPDYVVDFTTAESFAKWEALATEYDLKDLINGEYTPHGMKGQVWGEYVYDETDGGFCRYYPLEPLDENGQDKDGNTPVANGDFRMTIEVDVPITGDNQYLAFCYRLTEGAHLATNNIYLRDAVLREDLEKTKNLYGGSGEFNGNAGFYANNGMKCTGEWLIKFINLKDFRIEESLKGVRIPIAGYENEYFDIKWLCVFNQVEGKTAQEMKQLVKTFDYDVYLASLEGGDVAETTAEPEATDAPEETAVPDLGEDNEETIDSDGGCGSSVCCGAFVILAAALPIVWKKKKF